MKVAKSFTIVCNLWRISKAAKMIKLNELFIATYSLKILKRESSFTVRLSSHANPR